MLVEVELSHPSGRESLASQGVALVDHGGSRWCWLYFPNQDSKPAWFSFISGCSLVDKCDTLNTATQSMAPFYATIPGAISGVK